MRPIQYVTIVIAIALIAILYKWGNTIPPKKNPGGATQPAMSAGGQGTGENKITPASFDSILSASRGKLPEEGIAEVTAIENKISGMRDSAQMAPLYDSLARTWGRYKMPLPAANYLAKSAKLENSEKKLTFAGQFFIELMHDSAVSPSVQLWEAQEAEACLQQSIALAPENDTPKLALASVYLEATGEPMKGVELLLGIIRKKPDDIPANLMLGRMSIQSGQFDKALGRFETVLKQQPQNTEAMYFLAEAYKGKGDKKKAIELFEQCKRIVNKPEFSRDIDQYINSFK